MAVRIRQIIIIIMALVIAGGLYLLINEPEDGETDKNQQDSAAISPKGFDQLLVGQEFSDVAVYAGKILAGGVSGLYQIDPQTLAVSEIKLDDQHYQSVRALDSREGELWVGHESGLAIYKNGALVRQIAKSNGLIDPRIQDILRISDDIAYCGTYSGLAVIGPAGVRWLTQADGLPGDSIKVLMQDRQGDVWMGSYDARGGGAAVFSADGDCRQILTIDDGLIHNSITSIVEKPDGQIMIGGGVYTEGGASLLENHNGQWQVIRNLGMDDGLIGEKVRQLYIDRSDCFWFCSEYDGVAIMDDSDQIIRTLTVADGLSDNEVKQVCEDGAGNFWLATRRGVTRVQASAIR